MARWIIHLKDGRTFTDKDAYPWDFPQDQISGVERIINGKVYAICGSPAFINYFIKTTVGQSISLFGGGASPSEIIETITGCFVKTENGLYRLELVVDSKGNCKLIAHKVKELTKDGF